MLVESRYELAVGTKMHIVADRVYGAPAQLNPLGIGDLHEAFLAEKSHAVKDFVARER